MHESVSCFLLFKFPTQRRIVLCSGVVLTFSQGKFCFASSLTGSSRGQAPHRRGLPLSMERLETPGPYLTLGNVKWESRPKDWIDTPAAALEVAMRCLINMDVSE